MSLKQFLVEQDRINFARQKGDFGAESQANGQNNSRKRKIGDVEANGEEEDGAAAYTSRRRKLAIDGFLDCGSASWTILLSIFLKI